MLSCSFVPKTQDWLSRAGCQGEPTDTFFAADHERGMELRRKVRRAKRICWSCPVLESCRSHALRTDEPYGIWGGLTPTERRAVVAASSTRFKKFSS